MDWQRTTTSFFIALAAASPGSSAGHGARHSSDTNIAKMKFACAKLVQIYQIATI